jgi:hypothetical protein
MIRTHSTLPQALCTAAGVVMLIPAARQGRIVPSF